MKLPGPILLPVASATLVRWLRNSSTAAELAAETIADLQVQEPHMYARRDGLVRHRATPWPDLGLEAPWTRNTGVPEVLAARKVTMEIEVFLGKTVYAGRTEQPAAHRTTGRNASWKSFQRESCSRYGFIPGMVRHQTGPSLEAVAFYQEPRPASHDLPAPFRRLSIELELRQVRLAGRQRRPRGPRRPWRRRRPPAPGRPCRWPGSSGRRPRACRRSARRGR